jgi:hypothetical protein
MSDFFKTGGGIYDVHINAHAKIFYVNFVLDSGRRGLKYEVLKAVPYYKYNFSREGAAFFQLENGRYLYIGRAIIELQLVQNDTMVRVVSSRSYDCSALMTRFETYMVINDVVYSVRDPVTDLPVDIKLYFDMEDEISRSKIFTVPKTIIHNGYEIRRLHNL